MEMKQQLQSFDLEVIYFTGFQKKQTRNSNPQK